MFDPLLTAEGLAALAALAAIEIVLGIDNVIFISVLVSRLPPAQAERARRFGLLLALAMRIGLLFALTALMAVREPVLTLFGRGVSWNDIVLFVGGVFLIVKATHEMHLEVEGGQHLPEAGQEPKLFVSALVQIALIDLVFSVDSIVTAIGVTRDLVIMVSAVVIAMVVMYLAAGPVSRFIQRHPTTKLLALAFLMLIGVALVGESLGTRIDRPIIYAAMAFAVLVEAINLFAAAGRRRRKPHRPRELSTQDEAGQRDANT